MTIQTLLDRLDEAKRGFDSRSVGVLTRVLAQLPRRRFNDAESLIRYHEVLLFIRAYPPNATILKKVEMALANFGDLVDALRDRDIDLTPLEHPEVSGISGMSVTDTFSYYIVRWLVEMQQGRLDFYWDWFEDQNRLAETWPRFMPLLEEDAFVEANVPYLDWLRLARGRGSREVAWLIRRFEALPDSETKKAELYDGQKLYVSWTPPHRASRTGMKLPVRTIFFHRKPLIQRRDVAFREELEAPPVPLKRLSAIQGEAILDLIRETSTLRYRELYGFTHGDSRRVFKASVGRGVELFILGVPAERRLPLRAYHAAMIFKNGVPVGYFEGLSLCERMESGFNFYYGFREGETAWIYARTLNVFHHLLGVTAFSIDPYQIGFENEEGIESGAFWFYRKLGFRPTSRSIATMTEKEESKIHSRSGYRTTAATLRKLAADPMIFELDQSRKGDWDRFQVRNIGMAAQRRMATSFKGDAEKIRKVAVATITRAIGLRLPDWRSVELTVLQDLAVTLVLIPKLNKWTFDEKQGLIRIIRAKAAADEARYLKLMQQHARLRAGLIAIGSRRS